MWRIISSSSVRAALLLPLLMVTACTLPGSAAPVVKLGVIAPFEGQGRSLGYAVLPEIKAAVAEANAAGAFGPYRVTVVAFNDNLDPATAEQQAAALALDPDVFGVVGPFSAETAAAVAPLLASKGIPLAAVPSTDAPDEDFSQEIAEVKAAARFLLEGLAADIREHGRPIGPQPARP